MKKSCEPTNLLKGTDNCVRPSYPRNGGQKNHKNFIDYFLPTAKNCYNPHAFHPKRIVFYALSAITVKLIVAVFLLAMPIEGWLTPDVASEQSKNIIGLTNKIRASKSLPPLKENSALNRAALAKAQDMLEKQYFAHVSPDKKGLNNWLSMFKYGFNEAGENLAMGFSDASEVINAWTQSKTHYANLVDPGYKEIGVGVVTGNFEGFETTFIAQMFGTPREDSKPKLKAVPASASIKPVSSNISGQEKTSQAKTPADNIKTAIKTAPPSAVAQEKIKNQVQKPADPIEVEVIPAIPSIVMPIDKTLSNNIENLIRVVAPDAQTVSLYDNGAKLASMAATGEKYYDFQVSLEEGVHELTARSMRGNYEKVSEPNALTIDLTGPRIDQERSGIKVGDDPDGDKIKITVSAFLSPDTKTAVASFNNYQIDLESVPGTTNEWTGETFLFKQKTKDALNPIVLANVTASDLAGTTVTKDIPWENIKPIKTTLYNQYLFIKSHQSDYSKALFNISSIFYKTLLMLTLLLLGVNIFNQLKRRHHHIILSTIGFISLLVVLIIF